MAEQQQQTGPGGHYSGHNPIPTVKQFVENLDRDKKHRDKQLDEQAIAEKQAAKSPGKNKVVVDGDVQDHQVQRKTVKGTEKTVTDPTTGNQVTIADVDKSMMKEVDDPHLIVPNANLDKPTVSVLQKLHGSQLTTSAHQNRSESVARRLQVQSRRNSTTRPSRRRNHLRCTHSWRKDQCSFPPYTFSQL